MFVPRCFASPVHDPISVSEGHGNGKEGDEGNVKVCRLFIRSEIGIVSLKIAKLKSNSLRIAVLLFLLCLLYEMAAKGTHV